MEPIRQAIVEADVSISMGLTSEVASSINTPFIRRAVGLIALGLLNSLIIGALGVVVLFASARGRWDFWTLEFARAPTRAFLLTPVLLLGCVLVLAKQPLVYRILGGFVAFAFFGILLAFPGPGQAMGMEHFVVFWLCLVVLIPIRVLFSWSIHWSDEQPRQTRTGQFTIADFLSWTAAVAITLACFRITVLSSISSRSTWRDLVDGLGVLAASSLVAILCLWLVFSRCTRLRGTLWITLWVVGISFFWMAALLAWYYCFQSYPWWDVMLFGTRDAVYLLCLEISLLGNILAMEWLGLRWTRASLRSTP